MIISFALNFLTIEIGFEQMMCAVLEIACDTM